MITERDLQQTPSPEDEYVLMKPVWLIAAGELGHERAESRSDYTDERAIHHLYRHARWLNGQGIEAARGKGQVVGSLVGEEALGHALQNLVTLRDYLRDSGMRDFVIVPRDTASMVDSQTITDVIGFKASNTILEVTHKRNENVEKTDLSRLGFDYDIKVI